MFWWSKFRTRYILLYTIPPQAARSTKSSNQAALFLRSACGVLRGLVDNEAIDVVVNHGILDYVLRFNDWHPFFALGFYHSAAWPIRGRRIIVKLQVIFYISSQNNHHHPFALDRKLALPESRYLNQVVNATTCFLKLSSSSIALSHARIKLHSFSEVPAVCGEG